MTPNRHAGRALAAGLLLMAAVGSDAAEIVRHANPPPAIILNGVTLPPGAEVVLLSGQVASSITPAAGDSDATYGDTYTQTVSVLGKIETALARLGYRMADVIKLTAFVVGDTKLGGRMDFAGFNAGYRQFFGTAGNPNLVARSTVQVVALAAPQYLVEIEAMAAKAPSVTPHHRCGHRSPAR